MEKKKSMAWNSLIYAFKSVLGILFPLITFPYVSNVLGAENIGKVEYANSIAAYFIVFASLGITIYAVREGGRVKNDREALGKLSAELLIINCVSSLLAYLGILIVCQIPLFSNYALLILINSLSIAFTTMGMEWVYNVKEEFTYVTLRYLCLQILSVIFLFVFVKKQEDYYFYAIYIVLTTCGSGAVNVFCLHKHITVFKRRKLEIARHIKPVLLLFSISVAATIFSNLDTTMLGIMSGDKAVGIYLGGLKIDKVANSVLAAISLVAFSRSSYLLKNGEIGEDSYFKKMIVKFNGVLFLLAAPMTIGLIAVGQDTVDLLLNPEYKQSGLVLMIISGNILLSAAERVYGHQIMLGMKMDALFFLSTIGSVVIDATLNLLLIPTLGAIGASISTVAARGLASLYVIYCAAKVTKVNQMLLCDLKYVLYSLIFIPISLLVNCLAVSLLISLAIKIALCAGLYFMILLLTKDVYLYGLIDIVKGKIHAH